MYVQRDEDKPAEEQKSNIRPGQRFGATGPIDHASPSSKFNVQRSKIRLKISHFLRVFEGSNAASSLGSLFINTWWCSTGVIIFPAVRSHPLAQVVGPT